MKKLKYLKYLLLLTSCVVFAQDKEFEDLDGVMISAIEEYPSVKKNEFAVGMTLMPFDPYFTSYGINLAYSRYLNKRWAWEVLNASMVFGTEKALVNGLAENQGLQPRDQIEQNSYIVTSNMKYVLSYGKSIFFDRYIRMTRTELIGGVGSLSTTKNNYFTVNAGIQVDFVVSEHFSWKFEFINYFTFDRPEADLLDTATVRLMLAWRYK